MPIARLKDAVANGQTVCGRSGGRDVRQGGSEKQDESTVAIGH